MLETVTPIFLSLVIVVKDSEKNFRSLIENIIETIDPLVSDYEIVIVDNGSTDGTKSLIKELTAPSGLPNLQMYSLAETIEEMSARWIGVENSLGDFVICTDINRWDQDAITKMIHKIVDGYDLILTKKRLRRYRIPFCKSFIYSIFGQIAKSLTGIDLDAYSSRFLCVSRRVVNYILQFTDPDLRFRTIGSVRGFKKTFLKLNSESANHYNEVRSLRASINRGIKLVTFNSDSPIRVATLLCSIGAIGSCIYSTSVLILWILNKSIPHGWVIISIQQSVMFVLILLVLLAISEYLLGISRKTNINSSYYIIDEATSAKLTRKERLNIQLEKTREENIKQKDLKVEGLPKNDL
ncbi:glycosyltransferase [Prochlorococcus sp. MIT 1341]|uniref:glycosyltransferase n=1 Tax=Prochlorococcus sp. MIT 1341 TaxID=3096221 RepID=UPI002A7512A6|nr:glycosyltransferase [Prochlorococcus sp. MIT 1341]